MSCRALLSATARSRPASTLHSEISPSPSSRIGLDRNDIGVRNMPRFLFFFFFFSLQQANNALPSQTTTKKPQKQQSQRNIHPKNKETPKTFEKSKKDSKNKTTRIKMNSITTTVVLLLLGQKVLYIGTLSLMNRLYYRFYLSLSRSFPFSSLSHSPFLSLTSLFAACQAIFVDGDGGWCNNNCLNSCTPLYCRPSSISPHNTLYKTQDLLF